MMEIDEALSILSEIAEGEQERQAFETVKTSIVGILNDIETYRSLYEGAVKKIERYRDIAGKPDLNGNSCWQQQKEEEK